MGRDSIINPIYYFPSKTDLKDAVLKALHAFGRPASVTEINKKVIEILNLPTEVVELEDPNENGTKLNYCLRWCRTQLKQENLIINTARGYWALK